MNAPRPGPPPFRVTIHPRIPLLALLLWGALSLAARRLLRAPGWEALAAGGALAAGHIASEVLHQLGHATVARQLGHPASGIRLYGVYVALFYPKDEPELPAGIHIRRALGGPAVSLALSLLLLALAGAARPGLARRVVLALAAENSILVLQTFVPLGFNDGATLLKWLRRPPT